MNIFVGNLLDSVSANELRKLFVDFGTVLDVKVITDTSSGKPRHHGNVYLVPDAAAREAIAELHLAPIKGQPVVVREYFFRDLGERRINKRFWQHSERRRRHDRRQEAEDEQMSGRGSRQ